MHAVQTAMGPSDQIYYRLAWEAINYVRVKVIAGSCNREDDKQERTQKNFQPLTEDYLSRQRSLMMQFANEDKKPKPLNHQLQAPEVIDRDDEVCYGALLTEKNQFGNCGEQAGVAYRFLRKLPIAGLAYVNLKNGNHSFVVLGAGPNFTTGSEFTVKDARVALGDHAFVCDPWLQSKGMAFWIGDTWEEVIELMLKEALPGTSLDTVRVQCFVRCNHKTRDTKVREWFAREREKQLKIEKEKTESLFSFFF